MILKFEAYNPFENEFYEELSGALISIDDKLPDGTYVINVMIPPFDTQRQNLYYTEPFNKTEKDQILSIFPSFFARGKYNSSRQDYPFELEININDESVIIKITKLKDEWFLAKFIRKNNNRSISTHISTSYKCDQIGGLIKCIKDEVKL